MSDRDLHDIYSQRMLHHGCGMGLFVPVSSKDLIPPCCGFFDRNGDWNLITHISHDPKQQRKGYTPLREKLSLVTDVEIKWQPKTSLGVTENAIDTSASTPDNVAGGADAHIKYSSSSKFGAVLITKHPVTLRAYHQEALFVRWFEDNRRQLHTEYGSHLRKYGMWIVTKTYAAPGCSITAWLSNDKQALVTMKAKASMLGDIGGELTMEDTVMDKDWSHYGAKSKHQGEGVVVFVDGIDMKGNDWLWEGFKQNLPKISIWRKKTSSRPVTPERSRARRDFDADTTFVTSNEEKPTSRLLVPFDGMPPHSFSPGPDGDDIPTDAGPLHLSRASSVRRPSSVVSSLNSRRASRAHSLRRETRSISGKEEYHTP